MRIAPFRTASHRADPLGRLRLAIDCLPVATREAMLAAVREDEAIIAGAYIDGEGGVCPMLAAHRRGARTDLLSFAKSWDRFARTAGKARRASARERAILIAQLEGSLMSDDGFELDRAIAEHRALRGRRVRRAGRSLAGADPKGEIVARRLRASRRSATRSRQALLGRERVPAEAASQAPVTVAEHAPV